MKPMNPSTRNVKLQPALDLKEQGTEAEQGTQVQAAGTFALTRQDIDVLKAAFPKDRLGVKVQSFNRERNRAMLVLYLQHTDVQDRLEEVDPSWTSEVLSEQTISTTVYVRIRLTLKGVSRENVGEGSDPKTAYSDALKRSAMLFGVGRYLYDSPTVWCEYDDQRDRFRQWSVQDFEKSLQSRRAPEATRPKATPVITANGTNGASQLRAS